MKDDTLQITVLERQIIKAIIDNKELLFEEDIFISENAKELQYILLSLKDENKSFISEHIIAKAVELVDRNTIIALDNTEYQKEHFLDYKNELTKKNIIHNFRLNTLRTLNNNDSDTEKLLELEKEFQSAISSINGDNKGLTFSNLLENHINVLDRRATNIGTSLGCYNFDKLLPNANSGIALFLGNSGSCKTTFVSYLLQRRIAKRMPTTYINTELSEEAFIDGLTSDILKVDYKDIMGLDNTDNRIDFDSIKTKYLKMAKHYENKNKFLMYPKQSIDLSELNEFNRNARKSMGLTEKDLLVSVVDLLGMVKEFSVGKKGLSTADSITQAIDTLNRYALETNTLYICTWQLKRPQTNINIETEDDLQKYRSDESQIKNSSSLYERCRYAFTLYNPYNIVRKASNCNEVVKALVEPIVDITCIKNSFTDTVGKRVYYYFNSQYKSFLPYELEEKDNSVEHTEQNLDKDTTPYKEN